MTNDEQQHNIIIFGASGDLTWRKLVPALYNNYLKGRMPANGEIIGFARRSYTDQTFRDRLQEGVQNFSPESYDPAKWNDFSARIVYFQGNLDTHEDFSCLGEFLKQRETHPANRLYYLATAPEHYIPVVNCLGIAGLADQSEGWRRIIVEKPFGRAQRNEGRNNDKPKHRLLPLVQRWGVNTSFS